MFGCADNFCSIGGLRQFATRDKLAFSRKYNQIVLGFQSDHVQTHNKSEELADTSPSVLQHESPTQIKSEALVDTAQSQLNSDRAAADQDRLVDRRNADSQLVHATACKSLDANTGYILSRLGIAEIRPLQKTACELLLNASAFDTKLVIGPTSMGKDLIPFLLAVVTGQVQVIFVPYVALTESIVLEGKKFQCNVTKFSDIGKTVTLQSAAANSNLIVFSYEHAHYAVRIVQELISRNRLGTYAIRFKRLHVQNT